MIQEKHLKVEAIVLYRSLQVTIDELCEMCRINWEEVIGMVEEGIIDPLGNSRQEWRFHGYDIKKIQVVLRLQRDLKVNLPGAAVILDLLDEIEELKKGRIKG